MSSDKFPLSNPDKDLLLERQWQPITGHQLWELLSLGLSDHLDKVDTEITRDWQRKLLKIVTGWFKVTNTEVEPRLLKKLTNASLAAGSAGLDRVTESLLEWAPFKNIDQRKGKMESLVFECKRNSYKVSDEYTSTDFCRLCDRNFKDDDYIVSGKAMNNEDNNLHFVCFVAESVRKEASEYRNAKLGYYKQAKCVRSILATQRAREGLRSPKMIATYREYLNWREALLVDWQSTTTVKETFQNNYIKNFDDYVRLVLQARINPSIEISFLENKLSKHFDSNNFESIMENYLTTLTSNNNVVRREVRDQSSNRVIDFQVGAIQIETKKLNNIGQFQGIAQAIRRNLSVMLDISAFPKNQKQRLLDLIYGLIQGSNLKVQKISGSTYFITFPKNEMFSDEFKSIDIHSSESQIDKFFDI